MCANCWLSGAGHVASLPSPGEVPGPLPEGSNGDQQSGPHVHLLRLPGWESHNVLRELSRVRGIHVLPHPGTGASRGNRQPSARAE